MMKIVDSKLQGNCLQEFTAKYLEEHKDLIKYVKEETEKQLLIQRVSNQRELLIDFCSKAEDKAGEYKFLIPNPDFVDEYLKGNL